MPIHEVDIEPLSSLLSRERLAALIQRTGSPKAAIELHQETLRLGASLMHITATIEIAVRNSVSSCLEGHFQSPYWLTNPSPPFTWKEPEKKKINSAVDSAQRSEYSKLTQAGKAALDDLAFPSGRPPNLSHLKRAQRRRKQINVTHGKIVAELTLYFWKRLFGPDYEQSLWRTALKKTFPDKGLRRSEVAVQLEHIYQSRNRLAHHEPVLFARFDNTLKAIIFISQRLGSPKADPASPLANLLQDDIREVTVQSEKLHTRLELFRR